MSYRPLNRRPDIFLLAVDELVAWVTDAFVFAISSTIESVPAVPVCSVDGVSLLSHYLGVFEGRYWCRVALCEKGQESRIKSEA
jgi:hypothetical protein